MDDKAVRDEIISNLRDLGTDGWVCASAGADLIEAQAAELAGWKRTYEHDCQKLIDRAETAERRCAELVAALVTIRDSTFRNALQLRSSAERALTGDDRHDPK
jgi:hypothetical protein